MKYVVNTFFLMVMLTAKIFAQTPAQTLPSFTFFKFDKTAFTTNNLPAGKMLLFVFFDTDCSHCQHAMHYLSEHYPDFKKAAICLITLDNKEKVNAFMARYATNLINQKNITLLQDTHSEFLNKFRPRKYPSLFLYSAARQLLMYDDEEQNLYRFAQLIMKPLKK